MSKTSHSWFPAHSYRPSICVQTEAFSALHPQLTHNCSPCNQTFVKISGPPEIPLLFSGWCGNESLLFFYLISRVSWGKACQMSSLCHPYHLLHPCLPLSLFQEVDVQRCISHFTCPGSSQLWVPEENQREENVGPQYLFFSSLPLRLPQAGWAAYWRPQLSPGGPLPIGLWLQTGAAAPLQARYGKRAQSFVPTGHHPSFVFSLHPAHTFVNNLFIKLSFIDPIWV